MKIIKLKLKKSILTLVISAVFISSMLFAAISVRAVNATGSDIAPDFIKASSASTAMIKLVTDTGTENSHMSQLNLSFTGAGFATTDLAGLAVDATSGISVWNDSGTSGTFDSGLDTCITLLDVPSWQGGGPYTTQLNLTLDGTSLLLDHTFFVVIKTSGTIEENDVVDVTIVGLNTDLDGGLSILGTVQDTTTADVTAPTTTIGALSAYKTTDFTVSWSSVEASSGNASWTVESSEDAGPWSAWLTNVSYTITSANWEILNTTDGHTVSFRALAVDNASNCGAWSGTVSTIVDTSNPTANIIMPTNATWYNSLINITGTAADGNSGVNRVNITIYNSTGGKYWTGLVWQVAVSWLDANGTTSWYNNSGLPTWVNGTNYIINATAIDDANNIGTKDSHIFYYDTFGPIISSISSGTPSTTSATITWTTNENATSNVEYGKTIAYGTWSNSSANTTTHSRTLSSLSSSTIYYYRVLSFDQAGNQNSSEGGTGTFTTAASSPPPSSNAAPNADAGGPYSGVAGTAVHFDGSSSTDSDGTIVSYRWSFGDGATSTVESPTHTYTTAGTYTVTLTVTDDDDEADATSTTATITATPTEEEEESETILDETIDEINEDYDINLEEPFYANDTDGDGIVDTFTDPNDVLTNVNNVDINGNSSFLISTNDDNIPEFFWDTTTNTITPITHATAQNAAEPEIDPVEETVTIEITVNKTNSNWIYMDVSDAYPDYALTVKTSDGRIISGDMIWRENGKIYVLDDPDTVYDFVYGYITAPIFDPITETTFDTSKPTITITYLDQVTITAALFGTSDITDQITSTDGRVFTFTAGSDIADGTYTLSITAEDGEGATLTSTATYTIDAGEEPTPPFPLTTVIVVAIIIIIAILLIIALLFKTGYISVEAESAKKPEEEQDKKPIPPKKK